MRALLKNYRQSPRKVRLIADLIRGKNVKDALIILETLTKRGALPVQKLLLSAVANAKENNSVTDEDNLYIKEIRVDGGPTMKRGRPRAFGRTSLIRKRTSHILVTLGEREQAATDLKPKT